MSNESSQLVALFREPQQFERFVGLSDVLIDQGPQPGWLSRAYYATLVAGALSPADLQDPQQAQDFRTLAWSFVAVEPLLGEGSGLDEDGVIRQLRPAAGYVPQYSLVQVRATLDEYAAIVESDPPDLAAAVEARILGNPQLAPVARSITCLWYTATLLDLTPGGMGYPTKAALIPSYGEALVWKAIGGNPMGITGPYYGNWAYPSPQPILPPEPKLVSATGLASLQPVAPTPITRATSQRGK